MSYWQFSIFTSLVTLGEKPESHGSLCSWFTVFISFTRVAFESNLTADGSSAPKYTHSICTGNIYPRPSDLCFECFLTFKPV